MKQKILTILCVTLFVAVLYPATSTVSAYNCVNNVDLDTGSACVTITKDTGSGGGGTVTGTASGGAGITTAPNASSADTKCPNGGTLTNGPYGSYCNLGYTPLEPIPGIITTNMDFPTLLGNIYKIAIIIGALFSVLMLTVSGVRYMLSDIVTDKARAKKRITASLYGLVLIAASWLILNTINPQLVTFNLNPPTGIVSPATPTAPASTLSGFQQAAQQTTQNADAIANMTDQQRKETYTPATCAQDQAQYDSLSQQLTALTQQKNADRGNASSYSDQINTIKTQMWAQQDNLAVCQNVN